MFSLSNNTAIRKSDKLRDRKLLIPNMREKAFIDNVLHDPDKVIYKFSNYHLRDSAKLLLIKN